MSRTMEWAARPEHLGGIPRKLVIAVVGAFAKTVASLVNTTSVHNADTLLGLVRSRPPGVPLITVSNHMSTLDDPVMWGFKGFPTFNTKLVRWVLTAEDICFKNSVHSYIFRVGKCIPIMRGGGIYQEHMNEALERLNDGEWVHTFPEGKVYQDDAPIRRLKWGTASLIVRAPITPIVLPIVHHGFHKVMPEKKSIFGKRPPLPLCNKKIDIIIGDPIEFDLPAMKQMAVSESRNRQFPTIGWPSTSDGLDEAAQRCLYTTISEQIRAAMETLRCFGKKFLKSVSCHVGEINKQLELPFQNIPLFFADKFIAKREEHGQHYSKKFKFVSRRERIRAIRLIKSDNNGPTPFAKLNLK